ncbi:hypothetical protein EXIGLDRAFT_771802 [Exidia glandulosa HHB12029]|uniref:Uncharacterized protein n=1 Tax=Exidia glandulosa HHB12029 TaxID=1314781 RepID=A0A165FQE5_EXIGL|nr:hypothetical protein EXIGLDRAFT_771802 [Exidia glandulosa HHB12029]
MVLVPVSSLLALSTLAVAHPRPHASSSSSLSSRHATKKPITIPLPPRVKRSSKHNKNSSASDTKRRSRSSQAGPDPYSSQDGASQAMLAGRGEDEARRAQTHDTPLFKASKSKGQPLQYVGTKHASSHNKRATTASCSSLGSAAAGYFSIVTPTTVQPETPAPLANLMLSKPANDTPPSFLLNGASASYSTLLMITEGPPDPAANGTVPVMFGYPAGSGCLCVSANLGDTDDQHPPLALVPCDPEDASQQFALDPEMSFVSPLMVDTHAAAAPSGSGNATNTVTATTTTTTTAKPTKRGLAIPAPVTTVSAAGVVSSVSSATSARSAPARVEDIASTTTDMVSAKSSATALRVEAGVASVSMDPTTETVTTATALPTTLIDNEVNGVAVNTMYTSDSTLTTLASTTATSSTTVTDYVPLPTPPRGCNGKDECSDEGEDEGESTYDPCEGEGENCGKAKILGTRKVVGTPVELVEPYRYVFVLLDDSQDEAQAQDPNSKPAGQDSDSGVV